uniref:translation initiation factor IF-2-like n=1 Tax=Halichoerus grypus TaxID=9711 RepID=UPI001659CACE|nr:translation initiation factor IF-2-like [Halichoerus grypus]
MRPALPLAGWGGRAPPGHRAPAPVPPSRPRRALAIGHARTRIRTPAADWWSPRGRPASPAGTGGVPRGARRRPGWWGRLCVRFGPALTAARVPASGVGGGLCAPPAPLALTPRPRAQPPARASGEDTAAWAAEPRGAWTGTQPLQGLGRRLLPANRGSGVPRAGRRPCVSPLCPHCPAGSRLHWLPPVTPSTVSVRYWAVSSGPSFTGEALDGGGHGGFPGDALLTPARPQSALPFPPAWSSGSAVPAGQPGAHARATLLFCSRKQKYTDGHTRSVRGPLLQRPGPGLGVEGGAEVGRTGSKVDGAQRAWGCSPGGPCSTQKHEEEPRVDSAENQCFFLGHAVGPCLHLSPWQEEPWRPHGVTSHSQREPHFENLYVN